MWQCHYCRLPLSLDVQRKNRLCPNCGSDIHCCKNCIHYNEELTAKCTEPNGPWVADRAAQNSCEFFEFGKIKKTLGQQSEKSDSTTDAERAKEAFRALFRT